MNFSISNTKLVHYIFPTIHRDIKKRATPWKVLDAPTSRVAPLPDKEKIPNKKATFDADSIHCCAPKYADSTKTTPLVENIKF